MKPAHEITLTIIAPEDEQFAKFASSSIPSDCIPSTGDYFIFDGVEWKCTKKEIEVDHYYAKIKIWLIRA